MARRKNAIFTLQKTSVDRRDHTLIQAFYAKLNELIPGDTPVPIPPESQVHPKHDAQTQAYIFADYAQRVLTPIAFRAVGLMRDAAKLERLDPITNKKTAAAARDVTKYAGLTGDPPKVVNNADYAAYFATKVADSHEYAAQAAAYVAEATYYTAKLDPDATWPVVNEMLQDL